MVEIPWSQDEILLLLEALQAEPILWDPNDKCRKDKKKVQDAWIRIQDILEKRSIEDLKRKRESLIATYRIYSRKLEEQKKKGDDSYYPVWFAFDTMDRFFGSVLKLKQEADNEEGTILEAVEPTPQTEIAPTSQTGTELNSRTEAESNPQTRTEPKSRTRTEPSSKPKLRRINRLTDSRSESPASRENGNETFNQRIKKRPKDNSDADEECEIFGKLVAKKLKKVPEKERDDIMFEIHALFRRQCMEASSSVDSAGEYALQSDVPVKRQRTQAAYLEPTITFVTTDDYDNEGYGE